MTGPVKAAPAGAPSVRTGIVAPSSDARTGWTGSLALPAAALTAAVPAAPFAAPQPAAEPAVAETPSLEAGAAESLRGLGAVLQTATEPGGAEAGVALDRFYGEEVAASELAEAPVPAPEPSPETFHRDMSAVLDFLAEQPMGWRSRERLVREIRERVASVRAQGGVPRVVWVWWPFLSRTERVPVSPYVLAQLGKLDDMVRSIGERWWNRALWFSPEDQFQRDYGEMLYSIGELTGRSKTTAEAVGELDWIWKNYLSPRRRLS